MECKNCTSQLHPDAHFCPNCGAKVIRNRLTIKNLWEDFREQFLNYDNKLLKTYIGLFTKPADVIGSYINGTRKKYVNVLSYYAIALTLTGFQLFIVRKFFPEAMNLDFVMVDNGPKPVITDADWAFDYHGFFSLLNLPIYALVAKWSFIKLKKFNYTEHLVIMTYAAAQFSITNFFILTVSTMLGGNYFLIGNIANLLSMIYVAYIYKKIYPLTLSQIILRTLLFLTIVFVGVILAGVAQLAYLYFSGDLQQMIEDAKNAQKATSYIFTSLINWT